MGEAAKIGFVNMEILRSGVINTAQSLAAGVGAAKTFETQLFQIGPALPALARSLGGVGLAAGAAVGALVLVGGAVVALAARALSAEDRIRSFNTTLSLMGATSLATGADLEKSIRVLEQYGLSATEAKKALDAMVLAGLNPKFVQQIASIGAAIGAGTGQGSAAGVAQVTEAFKNLDTAIKFGQDFKLLTAAQIENAEQMGREGNSAKALTQILNILDQKTKGLYTGSLSEFTKAMNNATIAWNEFLDTLSKPLAGPAIAAIEALTANLKALAALLKGDLSGAGTSISNFILKQLGLPQITGTGNQAGQVIPLAPAGATGGTGTGVAGRVSLAPGVQTAPGVQALQQILGDASGVLGPGQSFQIFSGYAAGGGNRATGAASLHAAGNAVDVRVVNAAGQPVDTGVVGQASMGGGLPTPEMDRAILLAAQARGTQISVGSLFGDPDPGHYGIGASAEVANNQAKQAALLAGAGAAGAGGDVKPDDIQKSAKALADLTRARQNDLEVAKAQGVQADIVRAGQQAYDDALAKGLTVEDANKNRADAMSKAAAEGAAQWDKITTATDRATLATRDITEAYAKGGLAVVEATAATQALEEITTHYGTAVGYTAQIEERRQQILTQMAQAEKLQNAQDMQSQKDTQAALQMEISLQGQSSDVITEQLTLLKAKQDIDEKFPLLSEKEKDARLASVKATADLNAQLQEASRNQQRINDTLTSIGQTIDSSITQNIEAALSGQKITAWHDIFKNVLVQIEGQLLSLSVIKPAIGSVLGFLGFGGAAQSFGSLFSGAGILNPSGGGIFSGSTGTAGVTGRRADRRQ